MDSRLKERLQAIDKHIERLFHVEQVFLLLEGTEKSLLAKLTIHASGGSHAAKQVEALASKEWEDFCFSLAEKKAEYLKEKRRFELLLKAYDAEHATYKIENQTIKRQL